MSSEIIFFIIVVFLCLDFVLERVLESLNSKHMSPVLPDSLKGIYEEKEYSRFQSYKRENGRLDSWSSGVGFVVMIVFLVAGGFGWYNSWVVSLTDSVVWQTILFVVGLSVVSSVLDIPFDYYATFRMSLRGVFSWLLIQAKKRSWRRPIFSTTSFSTFFSTRRATSFKASSRS